jgi:hypothetical protein
MPLNKPTVGQTGWGPVLNAALDYLDAKIGATGPTGPTGPIGATGPTGPIGDANIADFTFTLEGSEETQDSLSKITISNHDMTIQTTRDADQDADITLDSADDVFIIAGGDDIHLEAADDVNITTGESQYAWEFSQAGEFIFPDLTVQTTAYVPAIDTPFTVVGGTLGDAPTFDGAPLFTGSYVKTGPMIHFRIDVDMDNITSFGTGQYYLDLPFPAKYNQQFAAGCYHDISTGRDYPMFGHVEAGESRMVLKSIDAGGNSAYNVPFTATTPVTLNAEDNFHISGDYIWEPEAP